MTAPIGGYGPGGAHWGSHPGGGHWGGTPSHVGGGRWESQPGVPMGATAWGPTDPYFVEPPPATYGEPIAITPDLIAAGQEALEQSGTYPAFGYTKDGALFMFSVRDGALVARPYLPPPGVGDGDGILPFLPSGLTRALGLPPPDAARLLTALGYAATMTGVRTFQGAVNLPDTGVVDEATMAALVRLAAAAGLSDPPKPEPTGAPIFDYLKDQALRSIALPGQVLRTASREFEREIGTINDGPGPQPTGISIKSIELPGYLQAPPVGSHTTPVATPTLEPQQFPIASIAEHEQWQRDHWRRDQAVAQGDYSPIPYTPSPESFYLYRLDSAVGWTPVGSNWLTFADAQTAMFQTDPNAIYGAYDQAMNWMPMSPVTYALPPES